MGGRLDFHWSTEHFMPPRFMTRRACSKGNSPRFFIAPSLPPARPPGADDPVDVSRLPDREYRSLDEVGEELAPVQPQAAGEPPLPYAESGEPPGGSDYVKRSPEPGAVRSG